MEAVVITILVFSAVLFKTHRKIEEPEIKVELISLDIHPRGTSHTYFVRSEFNQNQREAIAILESGDIKMFNDFCSEVKMSLQEIDACKEEVKMRDL